MKLSTKGRYAVMAMVDLARHAQAKPVSLSDIATRQEISLSYLEQLFARLRRAGLVKSVRGPGGGYRLARGSAETRVSEIILAVDEPIKATRCTEMGATGCRADRSKCLTHDLWEELGNQIHAFLSSVTLLDVLERRLVPRIAEAPAAANSELLDGRRQLKAGSMPAASAYLDHNATSPLRPEAFDAMVEALRDGRQSVGRARRRPQGARPGRQGAPPGGGAGRCPAGGSDLHLGRHRGQQHGAGRRRPPARADLVHRA